MTDETFPSTPNVPHNREAEEAVIGSVLIDPDVYPYLAGKLKAADFYIIRHAWIWEAFTQLRDRGAAIDFLTVTSELDRVNRLEECGGAAFLTALLNQVPTSLHAEHYADLVTEAAEKRRLLAVANGLATQVYAGKLSAAEIAAEAEEGLHGAARTKGGIVSLAEALSEHYDMTLAVSSGKTVPKFVPTGFYEVDKMLAGGMMGGDLVILGGRPGQGKSSTLLTIANHNLQQGRTVLLFSPEMSKQQITGRLLVMTSKLDGQTVRQYKLSETQIAEYTSAMEILSKYPLFLDDLQSITPQQMRARCVELQARRSIDLVIVDYLQLLIAERSRENRVQEVSYISRSLKMLARELNVPVLAASQLSRAVEAREEKRPRLSDLRESGSLEQDADIVMFVYELEDSKNGGMVPYGLTLAKQRNGPTGDAPALFNKSKAMLVNRA